MGRAEQKETVNLHTFIVPSWVLAMTVRFKESVTKPLITLSVAGATLRWSDGRGPISNVLRLIPDCIFHIVMDPVTELNKPKLPQAVTQTA